MSCAPLLTIDSLCVSIGSARILDGVTLEVAPGETLGLVGASGSGKSMTALAIMRLLPGAAQVGGSVSLKGEPVGAMSERRLQAVRGREIGIVFQEPMTALNPLMRIGDQVAETVRVHRSVAHAEAQGMARAAVPTER
jgi:peptide/nickel transport system ATP-binding protein